MSVVQRLGLWNQRTRRTPAILGSLLLVLTLGTRAHAVTAVAIDGHPNPVTLVEGETVSVHFDVAKPSGTVQFTLTRDLNGSGKLDPKAPSAVSFSILESGSGDADLAPGKVAFPFLVDVGTPAGPYLLHLADLSDGSALDLPLTVVPKPQPQALSGRVAVVSAGSPAGSPPSDAIIWAYSDPRTPAASAHIQPDGSYSLPVPPGSYIVFAEWLGSLRSQRQIVTVAAGQQITNANLPLLHGQEVTGTLRDDAGKPLANAPVQAMPTGAAAAGGMPFTTQSFVDGSYVLVLPNGSYDLTARGLAKMVTVADQPLDRVDFPTPAPGPTPAVGTILTVAGNGIADVVSGDGGPATAARLPSPRGIAVDKAGNLYIADNGANRVRKVDPTGRITTVAGSGTIDSIRGLSPQFGLGGFSGDGGPATAAQLNNPQHVNVDAAGNLYITETRNHRVRRVDASTGVITTIAGSGPIGLGNGSYSGDGGPATTATLNVPQALAFDGAGNLYIAEGLNRRVRKVGLDGIITTVAGGGKNAVTNGAAATAVALIRPRGLAVDLAGNLFIVDAGLYRILKVSPSGTISLVAGNGTPGFSGDGGKATGAQISLLWDLTVDSAGNLFFADTDNNRVRRISPDGIITTVVGSGAGGFAGDGGPATAARLYDPFGVAIDAAGNLFFSDASNTRIRKVIGIAAPGVIAGQ